MNTRRLVSAVIAATLVFTGLVALPAAAAGPAAPGGLSASAEADGTVHFEWAAAPGASAYRVEWSVDSSFPTGAVSTIDTYSLDLVTRWQPQVGDSTDLYWRVSSFGSGTSTTTLGDPSSVSLVSTGLASAPLPIGPGTGDGVAEITYPAPTVFSWQPVTGAIAYQLEYTSDTLGGGSGVVLETVAGTQFAPANPLARVDSNGNSLTWKWRVRAQFYNGTTSSTTGVVYGTWSEQREFQVLWNVAPTNLVPVDGTDPVLSDLSFSWDAVPGAAKYRVTLGTSVEGSGSSRTILNPVTRDVYTTTYIPTAQASDNTRYWQVTPLDYAGNLGTPSAVNQYRKKWGTQDGVSSPASSPDAAPVGITGSTTNGPGTPSVYLDEFELAWQPLPRATFYQLEVRDDFANLYVCRTASTSATIIVKTFAGLDNAGDGEVLEGSGDCLWETDANKRIQPGRTYSWRVRGVDYTGSSTTDYQSTTLPSGVQLSNWSETRYLAVKAEDRAAPTAYPVDLDLDAFTVDNPASASGQAAPLLTWARSGYLVGDVWWPAPAYEVTFYKNPQRTAVIATVRTQGTSLRVNGVFDDNTTDNPYYASVRPVSPQTAAWTGDALVLGGIDNESVESFTWQKASKALTGLATQTLSDGSVRLSWNPQSVTGLSDGGSRGYQIRVFNGAVQQGVTKKLEFPFFMAQKPASSDDSAFPSTLNDVPLPPGSNYTFEVAPLDANGNPGRLTKSGSFSVGIATPVVSSAGTVAGGSVAIEWSAVPGALKYSVQYRKVGTQAFTTVTGVSQTATVLNKLDQGTYEWQVRTHDASNLSPNVSDWSASKQFTIGTGTVTLQNDTGAVLPLSERVLRWSSTVNGAARFQVQIADDSAFTTAVKNYETVGTSFAIPDALTSAKQYYWRVKALSEPVNPTKVLSTSETRTFTTRTTPAKVSGLKVVTAGAALTASWTLLTGTNTGTDQPITYVVSYRAKSADPVWTEAVETETSGAASSYTVNGLDPGQVYEFRVAGKNSEGVGPWSDVKELATATAPIAAPVFTVTPKLGGLTLGITPVPTASTGGTPITGYRIAYRPSADATWTTKDIAVTSSYAITGLSNLTDYEVSVAAINLVGIGTASVIASKTLGLPTAPDAVTVTRGDKQATLAWAPPLEPNGTVTGYVVEYKLSTSIAWTSAGSLAATTTASTVKNLLNGKTYQFRVAAKTALGTGAFSAPVSVMPAGKPIPSTTLSATSSSTGTVTVSWGKANSNGSVVTGYIVKYSTNGTTWYTLKTVSGTTYKTTSTKGSHGKRIYFKVYPKNALGTGVASKTVSVIRK